MLWEERMGPLFTRLEHHYDTPKAWDNALAEHRIVFDAIGRLYGARFLPEGTTASRVAGRTVAGCDPGAAGMS